MESKSCQFKCGQVEVETPCLRCVSKERWPVVGSGGAIAQWRVLFEGRNVDASSLQQTLQATGGGNHAQRERERGMRRTKGIALG